MIVNGILDHAIKFKEKMFFDSRKQLLIYIKREGRVRKSRVIKDIKMGFILLRRRKELVISVPTGSVVNGISGNIVHTVLDVNHWVGKNYQAKINTQWLYRLSLIIDEVSMIDLKWLTLIDKQVQKEKGLDSHSITVFGALPLVVIIGDFYQFASFLGKALWDHLIGEEEVHGKSFWNRLITILTL